MMPADYAEVIRNIDSRIVELQSELDSLLAIRPALLLLQRRFNPASPDLTVGFVGVPAAEVTRALIALSSVTKELRDAE